MRPRPVTSHASLIVQASRWANGIVFDSSDFGMDEVTRDGSLPFPPRRLYLKTPPTLAKLEGRELAVRRFASMRTPEALACSRVPRRPFEKLRTSTTAREFFPPALAPMKHRGELVHKLYVCLEARRTYFRIVTLLRRRRPHVRIVSGAPLFHHSE